MTPPPVAGTLPEWTLADRLRKIRRDRHLTQEQMAQALGIKAVTWAAWESGRNRPEDVVQLANAIERELGIPAAWTLGILANAPARPCRTGEGGSAGWGRRATDFLANASAWGVATNLTGFPL